MASEQAEPGDPGEIKESLGTRTKRVMHSVAKSKTYCDAFLGSPEMAIAPAIKAGDVLFFNGKTIHGVGANRTQDRVRRSISTGFCSSFVNVGGSEEAHPVAISLDQARQMPAQVQKMIGFRSPRMDASIHYGSWRIDMQNLEDYLKL
jgi:ectoine hydroxylase-related dioxygenase (phytanoyl-CoA dioxygenase family)